MEPSDLSARRRIPLGRSLLFLLRHPTLLGTSLVFFAITCLLTWAGYHFSVTWIDSLSGSLFTTPPTVERFWDWLLLWGWTALKWIVLIMSRVVAFYLAFMLAYCLTTPCYSFLSNWAGNRFTRQAEEGEGTLSVAGVCFDLLEGAKIGLFGLFITLLSLALNLVPVLGQITILCIYVFYSALMFIDFPASRYRWSLQQKLSWLWRYRAQTFRMGLLPALVSMIPVANIFLMALCFPLFTVHATLNFLVLENRDPQPPQV